MDKHAVSMSAGPEFTGPSSGITHFGTFQTFPAMVSPRLLTLGLVEAVLTLKMMLAMKVIICGAVVPFVTGIALNLFSCWGIPLSPSQLTGGAPGQAFLQAGHQDCSQLLI